MPPGQSNSGPSALANLRNNTAEWWWRDAGLRKLAHGISVGFSGAISMGKFTHCHAY
jgi:hypothetical protein